MKLKIFSFIFLFPIILLYSPISFASGPYDGIWAARYGGQTALYASLHETSNNKIAIIAFFPSQRWWSAYVGIRNNNKITGQTVIDSVYTEFIGEILSDTLIQMTITKCEPKEKCLFHTGTILTLEKIW